jgi:thiamine-monophosphate kinase
MSARDEFALIAALQRVHMGTTPPGVEVGIGDDAAVLALGDRLVWTVDAQVDHVHFERGWLDAGDIGFRAHAAATSDIYAMGASPVASLASYVLPHDAGALAEAIAEGSRRSADRHGAHVVGGNLSSGTELSITTTVLGRCQRPILRSGARPGDGLYVAGPLGHAALGFRVLRDDLRDARFDPFVARWRRPLLPITTVHVLTNAHAAIDVSDGLAQDLGHLLTASGVGAELEASSLHDDELVRASHGTPYAWLDLVLHGGEDYAVVCASPSPLGGFTRIGTCTEALGLRLRGSSGHVSVVAPQGHAHRF